MVFAFNDAAEGILVKDDDNDDKITISTVFYRMFDPMVRTGAWMLQGINYCDDPKSHVYRYRQENP
jgi:hypothetical protein